MSDVLRTGRLALHPVDMGDHGALLAHWTGPLVRRYLFDDQVISAGQVTEIIAASQRDFAVEGYGLWALRPLGGPDGDTPSATLVGVTGLRHVEGPERHVGDDVEIVYSVEPNRWGQGLAAEAAGAVLDYAFGVVGLHRVTAEIDENNAASAELAERLGMRPRRGDPDGPDGRSGPARYSAERANWLGSRHTIEA